MSREVAGIGYEIHGEVSGGSRPPLVLIHGAGGNCLFWPPSIRRLEACTVYAIDLPGHGRSPGQGRDRIEAYVRDLLAWMDAVGVRQGVIAGHSMGSAIALSTAWLAHERVAGLALLGSGGRLRVHPMILDKASRPETYPDALDLIVQYSFSPRAKPRLVELARARMAEARPEVLSGDLQACDHFDVLDRLGEIQVPTLVMCGEEDQLTPEKYSRKLGERMPRAKVEIIPGAGHMLMLEQPAAVAEALRRFLLEQFPAR